MSKRGQSILSIVAAIVLSSTLLFSGFVKALDPLGMCIKLNAYLAYFGIALPDSSLWLQLSTAALTLLEFTLGLNLLLGIRRRLSTMITLGFIVATTTLTLWTYIANPVTDCGCFGEALKLTHGQTLAKNIILLIPSAWLACHPLTLPRLMPERSQWMANIYAALFLVGLIAYTFHRLPLVEMTDYRIGSSLREALFNPQSEESHTDMANFILCSPEGEMLQDSILMADGYTFLVTLPDEDEADDGCNDLLNDLYDLHPAISFYGIIAEENKEQAADWVDRTGAAYPILSGESTQIKAMVRSNPGLMLLHDGRIVAKWSHNNLPTLPEEGIPNLAEYEQRDTSLASLIKLLLWLCLPLAAIVLLPHISRKPNIPNLKNNNKTMRKKIVAGNWKMNKNLQEGVALATELNEVLSTDKPNCGVVICTPFIHLASVADVINKDIIGLGAENCADKASGAYTGEVSAEMVKSTGADYVILGHSERRAYYGETAEILKEKVNLALANNLEVIFCIGEVLEEREAGKQNEVVRTQLEGSLFELTAEQFSHVVLAYEPVWAIGTGKTATAEQAEEMHAFIRQTIADKFGAEAADNTTILYGGSCKPSNAKELFAKPDVDGGLIGGASLKAADFKGIIDAWK
ncbi:MAG: triose-phosphate isomerase [Alloprevotella sp.]|nr:triose-phosphate isomerase [Alloprevotella sp.]